MKIKEIKKVSPNKKGCLNSNGVIIENNEKKTFNYLILFGFNIELIRPTAIKATNNPDILIMGTIWEVKTPISSNHNTIKNRFRKASKQATNIIFDLRFIKHYPNKAEKQLINLFTKEGRVRRMMIIKNNGKLIDCIK